MPHARLFEDVHTRVIEQVLAAGHVFTDDTVLPLQNRDLTRCTTINARLWVYARSRRRHQPLVYYEFTRDRSQQGSLARLKDYQGYLEPDNNFAEQCLGPVAVGRKAFLFVGSERAGHAAEIYYSLMEGCKLNKVNPLTYMTYLLSHVRNKQIMLKLPHEFNTTATDIVDRMSPEETARPMTATSRPCSSLNAK